MTWELVLAFNLALLAAIASPGPAFLLAIRTALVKGKWSGIKLGIGLGLMASTWTLAALLGLDSVFKVFPWAYLTMKLVGAAYLLYIAWNTWRNASQPLETDAKVADHALRDGILLNLSNPKSVLFAAAVLVVIFPPDLSLAAKGFIVFNHLLVEIICYSLMAIVISQPAISDRYLAAKRVFDRICAVVMGGLGFRLLLDR